MSPRWLMGITALWIIAHLICAVCEGSFGTGGDIKDTINALTGFDILESQGIFGIPAFEWRFFTNLPTIVSFDYGILETGGAQIIRYFLCCISIGVAWGLIQTFGPALQGMASSFLRLGR